MWSLIRFPMINPLSSSFCIYSPKLFHARPEASPTLDDGTPMRTSTHLLMRFNNLSTAYGSTVLWEMAKTA